MIEHPRERNTLRKNPKWLYNPTTNLKNICPYYLTIIKIIKMRSKDITVAPKVPCVDSLGIRVIDLTLVSNTLPSKVTYALKGMVAPVVAVELKDI